MPIHLLIPKLSLAAAALGLLAAGPVLADAALPDGLYAQISTPRGVITCELEYARTPLTVVNFVGLAEGTLGPAPRRPFFDGLKFHRVVPHFVIQGGDPLNTGEGGPGYAFADEFSPGLSNDVVGALSMANEGPDTNGSQFFLTLEPVGRLDYLHTVFGRTVGGAEVLRQVAAGDPMTVHILRVGAAARAFRADDGAFAALAAKIPKYAGEKAPGPGSHFDDPEKVLPTDPPRAQNFNFKLCNVERATGVRIYARVFARFAPEKGAQTPQAMADGLARSTGIPEGAVLAAYFADTDTWAFHVGASLEAVFKGGQASQQAATASLLEAARRRAARYTAQTLQVMPNALQTPGQKPKIATDAVLDELIARLCPRS